MNKIYSVTTADPNHFRDTHCICRLVGYIVLPAVCLSVAWEEDCAPQPRRRNHFQCPPQRQTFSRPKILFVIVLVEVILWYFEIHYCIKRDKALTGAILYQLCDISGLGFDCKRFNSSFNIAVCLCYQSCWTTEPAPNTT